MKIEQWSPEKLVDYARNPRKNDHAVERVAAAIREFGFRVPIIAKSDGLVVDGHLRLKAARKLGLTSVPVVLADDMSETQIKAFRISVNRMAELAEWDTELLALEMQDLTAAGVGMDLSGFSSQEFDALIASSEAEDKKPAPEIEEDEPPEAQEKANTKAGDVWLLGEHRVMCGDSTLEASVSVLFAGNRSALCFTSPPYNLGKSVQLRRGPRKTSAYNNIDDDSDDWHHLMRNFLSNASAYSDVCAVNVQLLAGNKIELLRLFGEFAEKTIDVAIWSKTQSQPAFLDGVMNSAFEFIWLLSNEQKPSRRIKTASFARGCFSNVYTAAGASGHDASVHGAVFPLKVAAHYVSGLSPSGSSIYDPFLGTGTTLIAAEQLGRKCYGMELSPQYCDVIVKRWQTLTGKQAVRESDGVTFDEAGQT